MRKNTVIILTSLVVGVGLVVGAFLLKNGQKTDTTPPPAANLKSYTTEELARNNGKNGHDCLVAVQGKVYKVSQGQLWQNGEHTTSEGQAMCGRDLSEVITKSPHGTSKLSTLEVVGSLGV